MANPYYDRLNPSSLGTGSTPTECEENIDILPLVVSFLGHPSIPIIKEKSRNLGEDDFLKVRAYIDSLFVAAGRFKEPKNDLLTPEQSVKIAKGARHNKGSLEHFGTALFCLRDSIDNVLQMLFSSFVFKRIPTIDENMIFQIKPNNYGDFKLSYIDVAEPLCLSPGDPFLLKVNNSMGREKPALSFVNSYKITGSRENGLELKLGFREVDDNLSAFSTLL